MKEILDLLQRRTKCMEDARAIHEVSVKEKRALSAEEENSYTAAMDDYQKLDNEIRSLNRQKELDKAMVMAKIGIANRSSNPEKEIEVIEKFEDYLRNGKGSVAESNYRALQQDSSTAGGFLVAPQQFMNSILQNLYKTTMFRQKARVLPPLVKSESLGVPTKTASMSSASWGSEIGSPTPDTALSFGKREFRTKPCTAEILVSKTLIRNAAISPMDIVMEELTHQFAELHETAFFTGDGVDKPLGVFTASNDGIPTSRDVSTGNTTSQLTFDGLIEAKYSITKTAYWKNLEWYFHNDAVKMLCKIKDAEGLDTTCPLCS